MTCECSAYLRIMIDKVIKNLRVLATIELLMDAIWNIRREYGGQSPGQRNTKGVWATIETQVYIKWAELLSFLKPRCHILESIESSRAASTKPVNLRQATPSTTKTNSLLSSAKPDFKCWVCEKPHYLTQYKEFLSMSPENRQST
jgi:hypothetical protein